MACRGRRTAGAGAGVSPALAAAAALALALALAAASAAAAGSEYGYDYAYDGLYADDAYSDYLDAVDDYGYYGDEGDQYYDDYGYYGGGGGDLFGYDEYYDEYYDDGYDAAARGATCKVGKDGKVELANGTAGCDVKVEGVDKQADKLAGGVDGLYKLYGCHDGRPAYRRHNSPAGEERTLWYGIEFGGDWDVSKGPEPNAQDVLMYGGDLEHQPVPMFVKHWHLGADLQSGKPSPGGNGSASAAGAGASSDEFYVAVQATVKCASGEQPKAPAVNPAVQKQGPVLTDQEMEAKYRRIYDQYARRPEPNPTVNFSFVVMLVMIGLSIVLSIPYFLLRKRAAAAKGYQPVATTFAQVIQQSKKKQSGHIH